MSNIINQSREITGANILGLVESYTTELVVSQLAIKSVLIGNLSPAIQWIVMAGDAGFEPTSPAPKAGRISRLP